MTRSTDLTSTVSFASDVEAEQRKLIGADFLIFQFPLWWFGLPVILKGWVDRVFAAGPTYGSGRWYSHGVFKGRRAMLSLTTVGAATNFSPAGLSGHLDSLLFQINHGILHFVGFDVLPPFGPTPAPKLGRSAGSSICLSTSSGSAAGSPPNRCATTRWKTTTKPISSGSPTTAETRFCPTSFQLGTTDKVFEKLRKAPRGC